MKSNKTHYGNVEITVNNQKEINKLLKDVTDIKGDIYVYENGTLNLPLLATSGYISVRENGTLNLPLLATSGDIYVYENGTLNLPLLATSGYISVYENATLNLPLLATSGYISVRENATLNLPLLATSGDISVRENATLGIPQTKGLSYRSIDNTLFVVESERTSKGIKIYSGYILTCIKKGKSVKKQCYVSEKDKFFAHGETVKLAISELQFKFVADKLKNEPIYPDTLVTVNHYRMVTGACQLGIRAWMDSNGLEYEVQNSGTPSERTIEKNPVKASDLVILLRQTNAYGSEKFESLITED